MKNYCNNFSGTANILASVYAIKYSVEFQLAADVSLITLLVTYLDYLYHAKGSGILSYYLIFHTVSMCFKIKNIKLELVIVDVILKLFRYILLRSYTYLIWNDDLNHNCIKLSLVPSLISNCKCWNIRKVDFCFRPKGIDNDIFLYWKLRLIVRFEFTSINAVSSTLQMSYNCFKQSNNS